jgi:hypothetical protein
MQCVVRGASFDKKEFKRNLAGSVSYPPVYTVDKLNKSKLSGLVNVFTMVLPLVHWWWWCWCLLLWQWTKVSSTVAAAAAVVAAVAVDDEDGVQWWRRGGVQWRWQRLTTTAVGATDRQ